MFCRTRYLSNLFAMDRTIISLFDVESHIFIIMATSASWLKIEDTRDYWLHWIWCDQSVTDTHTPTHPHTYVCTHGHKWFYSLSNTMQMQFFSFSGDVCNYCVIMVQLQSLMIVTMVAYNPEKYLWLIHWSVILHQRGTLFYGLSYTWGDLYVSIYSMSNLTSFLHIENFTAYKMLFIIE